MTDSHHNAVLDQSIDAVTLSIPQTPDGGPPLLTVALAGLALRMAAGADTGFEQMRRALEQSTRFDRRRFARLLENNEPGEHTLWH